MKAASVGFHCPECVKAGAATVRTPKAAYGGKARSGPLVTQVLLGLNAVMFLITTGTGSGLLYGGYPSLIFQRLAQVPTTHGEFDGSGEFIGFADGVAQGQYFRLLTATFLHYGIIHLALNMYCLWFIGPFLEQALGRLRFTALYLLSGLGGSALSYALGPTNSMAAGASGAVFGLFAAFFVLQRRRGQDVSQISVTIGINLILSFTLTFIDWRGHVGGLIAGALVTAALVYAPTGKQRSLVQAVGCVAVGVLIAGIVVARTAALTT